MINQDKLDFWVNNNLNTIFISKAGVGKSSIIKQTFARHNLNYLYFSAATLDVFTDLIGIPRVIEDKKEGTKFLEYIKPKHLAYDQIQAIFIDELGRGSKRVLNSVFELLQFKSLNGTKLNNLRFIWAATNPEDKDEETGEFIYHVERLDPALKDRFHVIYELPYKTDKAYFYNKFEKLSDAALNWWNDLGEKERELVSPRRLDYALEIYQLGGDIRDVLPKSVNISKLITELSFGSFDSILNEIYDSKDVNRAKSFLLNEVNYQNTIDRIKKKKEFINFFLPHLSDEKFASILDERIVGHVVCNKELFKGKVDNILNSGAKSKFIKELSSAWKSDNNKSDKVYTINLVNFDKLKLKKYAKEIKAKFSTSSLGVLQNKALSEEQFLCGYISTEYGCKLIFNTIVEYYPDNPSIGFIQSTFNTFDRLLSKTKSDSEFAGDIRRFCLFCIYHYLINNYSPEGYINLNGDSKNMEFLSDYMFRDQDTDI